VPIRQAGDGANIGSQVVPYAQLPLGHEAYVRTVLQPGGGGDVFLVHCPETDRIYAVAVGDSGVLKAASLRVRAPANNQLKGIRWAADHELPA
jgi:hypothetical protein